MKNLSRLLVVLLMTFSLAGCIGSEYLREQRITSNQEAFNSYSPEVQTKVRAGQVDIGFNQEMVYLAWGKADRIYTRVTKEGVATVWAYTGTKIRTESHWISIPVREVNKDGKSIIRYRRVWIDRDTKEEYTVARVEFIDGLVTATEQLSRGQ